MKKSMMGPESEQKYLVFNLAKIHSFLVSSSAILSHFNILEYNFFLFEIIFTMKMPYKHICWRRNLKVILDFFISLNGNNFYFSFWNKSSYNLKYYFQRH